VTSLTSRSDEWLYNYLVMVRGWIEKWGLRNGVGKELVKVLLEINRRKLLEES
jgi:hypothetical protein